MVRLTLMAHEAFCKEVQDNKFKISRFSLLSYWKNYADFIGNGVYKPENIGWITPETSYQQHQNLVKEGDDDVDLDRSYFSFVLSKIEDDLTFSIETDVKLEEVSIKDSPKAGSVEAQERDLYLTGESPQAEDEIVAPKVERVPVLV